MSILEIGHQKLATFEGRKVAFNDIAEDFEQLRSNYACFLHNLQHYIFLRGHPPHLTAYFSFILFFFYSVYISGSAHVCLL